MSDDRPRISTRDHQALRTQLTDWLAHRLDQPEISNFVVPASNGMSSETILFDVETTSGTGRYVLRLPPDPSSEPVFPVYDMPRQYLAMELVGRRTTVPVPATVWLEGDSAPLGAPFFVMKRVDGLVPPDVMPYPFGDNWLFDASPDDRAKLQKASVDTLAQIHSISAADEEALFLAIDAPGETSLHRHVNDQRNFYAWVCADGVRSPLIERAFAWLDENWPVDEGEAVVSWGDSRIGNIIYRDFLPAAVLDWEMVGHAPREVDLGWMIFLHRFFQDIAEQFGLPGLPGFMHVNEVADQYEATTGHTPQDLQWYMTYAALRHAVIMFRITRRQIMFGEAAMPDNPDHAFIHHETLTAMLDGSYWSRL
jgi:aminoglycoside phosphotransferase (APT) family kinase protein